ncbi:hypothetical protein [Pedobacter sp. FW305-3-2-15-E-R2A2]|jgi:hypothetical protein
MINFRSKTRTEFLQESVWYGPEIDGPENRRWKMIPLEWQELNKQ